MRHDISGLIPSVPGSGLIICVYLLVIVTLFSLFLCILHMLSSVIVSMCQTGLHVRSFSLIYIVGLVS